MLLLLDQPEWHFTHSHVASCLCGTFRSVIFPFHAGAVAKKGQ